MSKPPASMGKSGGGPMMSLGVWVIADQLHLLLISEMRTLAMVEQVAWRNAEVDREVRMGQRFLGRKRAKKE